MDPATVQAALADWRSAPIPERLRAMLAFLEKLTLTPAAVGAADVRVLREAGLSDTAIREGIYVCFLFNTLDRLADALDFALPSQEAGSRIVDLLDRFGYGVVKLPG